MRIMLTGGGTGGHIYPALAIAKELKAKHKNVQLAYVGKAGGMEEELVKREGISFKGLSVQGFNRRKLLSNWRPILSFLQAIGKSRTYLREFKPDVVIGTGGYVSAPTVFTAYRMGVPTVIHEQNLQPGLTTRFLARFSKVVAISMAGTKKYFPRGTNSVLTGNPRASVVRTADASSGRKLLGLEHGFSSIVVIVAGSQGASTLNKIIVQLLQRAAEWPNVQFVYVTGDRHYEGISQQLDMKTSNIHLHRFLYDLPSVLAAASVIISRAGATTLAEVTALGLPSILIPSPYVTNNHQEHNARVLEKEGAAIVILENELTVDSLATALRKIISKKEISYKMQLAARNLGCPEAASRVVEIIDSFL